LRNALHDPITEVDADALRLVALKVLDLDDVISYLKCQPLTWDGYVAMKRDLAAARELAHMQDGLISWESVRRAAADVALQAQHEAEERVDGWPTCPGCGRMGRALDRVWVKARLRPAGFNGWVYVCRPCGLQVAETGRPRAIF
jgi:hypothetical protein